MRLNGWITLIYALIIFLGGIFGYVKAESVPSLIMGVSFATILSMSAFMMFNEKLKGYLTALGGSSLLLAFFTYRFFSTLKFMPAGMMCLISMAVLMVLILRKPTFVAKE